MKAIKPVLLSLCLLPALAWGQNLAILDVEEAIRGSQAVEELNQSLQQEFSADRERLVAISDEFEQLKEKAQKEADFLSQEARQELMAELEAKAQEGKKLEREVKQEIQAREQEMIRSLLPQVEALVIKLAEEKGLDVVMNARTTFYTSEDVLNLTPLVVERLNQQ